MNKIVTVVITGVTAVAMSACSGSSEPAVTQTETVTSSPQEQAPSSPEAGPSLDSETTEMLFVEVIREEMPNLSGSDDELVALGHEICTALDEGLGINEVAQSMMTDTNLTPGDAGFIIGASIAAFCSSHGTQV